MENCDIYHDIPFFKEIRYANNKTSKRKAATHTR